LLFYGLVVGEWGYVTAADGDGFAGGGLLLLRGGGFWLGGFGDGDRFFDEFAVKRGGFASGRLVDGDRTQLFLLSIIARNNSVHGLPRLIIKSIMLIDFCGNRDFVVLSTYEEDKRFFGRHKRPSIADKRLNDFVGDINSHRDADDYYGLTGGCGRRRSKNRAGGHAADKVFADESDHIS
jgi:hypothetical protein